MVARGDAGADPAGRGDRDPLRGPEGRAGHAGDAHADLDRHGRGPGRQGRADHRRPLQRRLRTASSSATSAPRRRRAGRSRWCATATASSIDVKKHTIELAVPRDELARRRAAWTAPPLKATRGTLAKYIRTVKSASRGLRHGRVSARRAARRAQRATASGGTSRDASRTNDGGRLVKTGAQYRASLNDGRATYFEGKRIDDIEGDPVLGHTVREVAATYDRFYSPDPDATSPLMRVASSAADLKARIPILASGRPGRERHVSIDHDADDGRREDGRLPEVRGAHRRLRRSRAAGRHPHRRVHHRREGRPLAAAEQAARSGRSTCAWSTATRTAS